MSDEEYDVIKLVATFGLVGAAFGFIIGTSAYQLIRAVTEDTLVPLMGSIFDVSNIQNSSFYLNGSKIKIGGVFLSFIIFILSILVVYALFRIFKPHITAISDEKNRANEKILEQNEQIIKHLSQLYQ